MTKHKDYVRIFSHGMTILFFMERTYTWRNCALCSCWLNLCTFLIIFLCIERKVHNFHCHGKDKCFSVYVCACMRHNLCKFMLKKNSRAESKTRICLSISKYVLYAYVTTNPKTEFFADIIWPKCVMSDFSRITWT